MNTMELSQIKEEDAIYDQSAGIVYKVITKCKSGILTHWTWDNLYGRFTECKYFKYEEVLCKDMILM